MSPAHLHHYAATLVSPSQLSESLPASQVGPLSNATVDTLSLLRGRMMHRKLTFFICLQFPIGTWGVHRDPLTRNCRKIMFPVPKINIRDCINRFVLPQSSCAPHSVGVPLKENVFHWRLQHLGLVSKKCSTVFFLKIYFVSPLPLVRIDVSVLCFRKNWYQEVAIDQLRGYWGFSLSRNMRRYHASLRLYFSPQFDFPLEGPAAYAYFSLWFPPIYPFDELFCLILQSIPIIKRFNFHPFPSFE